MLGKSLLRIAAKVALGLLAAVTLVLVVAQSPPIRSRALLWSIRWLASNANIDARIGRLDYNLFTGRVAAEQVTLAGSSGGGPPFFEADAVRLRLPWSAVTGTFVLNELTVDRPRITIERRTDGTLNLPASQTSGGSLALPPVDRVAVRDLSFTYSDRARQLNISTRQVSLNLARQSSGVLEGRLSAGAIASLRSGERATTTNRIDGRLSFDGANLALTDVMVEAPEGRLDISGRIERVLDGPSLDLTFTTRADVASLVPWLGLGTDTAGDLRLTGRVRGPIGSLTADVSASSDSISWDRLQGVAIRADAELAADVVTVRTASAAFAGGTIAGRGRMELASGGQREVHLEWKNLQAEPLLSLARFDMTFQPAARMNGGLDARWTTRDDAEWTLENQSHAAAAGPSSVPVAGSLTLVVSRGRWQAEHDHRVGRSLTVAGHADGRIGSELAATTVAGDMEVTSDSLSALAGDLVRMRLASSDVRAMALDGEGHASLRIGGTVGAPTIEAAVSGTDIVAYGVGPASLEGKLLADREHVRIAELQVQSGENALLLNASETFDGQRIDGRVTGTLPAIDQIFPQLASSRRPGGALSLEATIGGTLAQPRIEGSVSGRGLEIAGQAFSSLTTGFRVERGIVYVDRAELAQEPAGRLSFEGRYTLAGSQYSIRARGEQVELRPLPAGIAGAEPMPLTGRLTLDFEGDGSLKDPAGRGHLVFSSLDWDGHELAPVEAELIIGDGSARITAGVPQLALTMNARTEVRTPWRFDADARFVDVDLARLAEIAVDEGPAVQGRATFTIRTSGILSDVSGASADLDLQSLAARVEDQALELAGPARLRYADHELSADNVDIRAGRATVTVAGRLSRDARTGGLHAAVAGPLEDLDAILLFAGAPRELVLRGTVDARVDAVGSFDRPSIDAKVSVLEGSVQWPGVASASDVTLETVYQGDVIHIRDLRGIWQGASVTASGELPARLFDRLLPAAYLNSLPAVPATGEFRARIEGLTPAALEPFISAGTLSQITGRATVALEGQIDGLALEQVRGTATIEQANLTLAGVPLAQETPTTLVFADQRLVIPPSSWGGAGSRISFGGVVSLGDSPQVDVGAGGTFDLRLLSPLLSNATTSGNGRVTLRVNGAAANPSLDGSIEVGDGGLRIRDPRIAVSELSGLINLAEGRLTIERLQGSVNGGSLVIAGGLGLDGYRPAAGRLTFTAREVPLDFPEGVRSQIDADLVLQTDSTRPPELTGNVSVLRGLYRERISLTRQFLESSAFETVVETDETSYVGSTRLNVTIGTKDDVRVDNNYGRLELGGDLRLLGTIAQPGLQGRATIREGGRVYFGGNTYEIERGIVDFTDPAKIEPTLNISARTRVSAYDVTLNLTGAPGAIETNLTSDPPLGQDDLVSLLLTGRTLDQPGSFQATVAREQLLALLSGELLGAAGRSVGLDTLRLERGVEEEEVVRADPGSIAGETDPSARLTVAKSIRRDMEFILSRDLRESGGITVIASYRPRRTIELRAISRDNTDRSYEFRQDLSFGGTGAARVRPSRAARRLQLVGAVLLTGTPGFPEQELLDRLKLTAGDRFDFFRWQDDQDRLLDFHHDRGYLEARIAARRHAVEATADSGVELEYEIERGPRTELSVEGYGLSGDVMSRMREEWTLAVFDQFLLDELRRLAREQLVEDGFPRAAIDVQARPTAPDERHIVVTIAPGPHVDAFRLQFQGNAAVDSLALEAFVKQQRLERAGWIDPTVLEKALADYYRAHSRLAASITVGESALEGSAAILPVTIVEGPAFRWSAIRVEGVGAERTASVQEAVDLREGDAFRSGTLPAMRRAVEAQYRREGFNAARVAVSAAVHRESATVNLTVTVDEGRRQVLEAIETRGANQTNESFLADSLQMDKGSVVELADVAAARKRLYDTGVFRRADIEVQPLTPDAISSPPDGGDEPVRALVTVEEVAPYRLRYGLQLNDEFAPVADQREFGPGLTVDFQRQNLWGRAAVAGLAFRYDREHRIGRAFFSAPRFFGRPLVSTVFLSRTREIFAQEGFTSFITDKSDVSAEQRFRPLRRLEVAYGYRFEQNRTFDPNRDPDDPLGLDVSVHIARLNGATIFDTRDDRFDATRGWFHGSNFEYAPEVLGSDLRFSKYLLQQYYYRPFGRMVVATAARLGLAQGYGQDLIPSEKYYAGGGNSVRGYREDSIAGRDFFGDPIGGNAMLVFNEELRFPIYGRFRGVGFLDAGNVYTSVSELSFTDLKVGVGLGLRINTPFALLRVDFGVPLSRERGERRARWFFSFGQMF